MSPSMLKTTFVFSDLDKLFIAGCRNYMSRIFGNKNEKKIKSKCCNKKSNGWISLSKLR